ncbi:5'/3'-nucleotidase SurE [Rosistilla oblonga]|uniref:5'/3'-nucleotidase SurE n=1 Tax=Rosistilla oblonga TaxID=2527990 RepID=UPI00118A7B25|nr:5'/3'-nucleotidase SurE [Rosistilla oblonga]QDV14541.1 5'/3'-nucleotidase SurE [Rosistilla oblonga]
MRIMLTNDDGIFAPGLEAMEREFTPLGDVQTCAPTTEQSGVGHSITYLTPLTYKEVFRENDRMAFAVDGSPADCVKLGISELCEHRPDVVISGINSGLNAGINVLYSGTVAAAIEAAFFGVTSFAVSLEYDPHADYRRAAEIAREIVMKIVARDEAKAGLFNINIPTAATRQPAEVRVVPMGIGHYGSQYIKRQDPNNRDYYWATVDPPPAPTDHNTDLNALAEGFVTVSPLKFDLTRQELLSPMKTWEL